MIEKEFNLSDKVHGKDTEKYNDQWVWANDVKEFIKRLKDYYNVMFAKSLHLKPLIDNLDALAGDKLK